MSILERVKSGVSSAGTSIAHAANTAVTETQRAIEQLKATPQTVKCARCATDCPVPPNAWNWTCEQGHENTEGKTCGTCNAAKPKMPNPTVTCPQCQSVITCPSTVLVESLRSTPVQIKEAIKQGTTQVKEGVEQLRAAPKEFKCSNCQTLLAVPAVPWQCQCNQRNEAEMETCSGCQLARPPPKVLCGVCRRSTNVPSSNLEAQFLDMKTQAKEATKEIYFKTTGTNFVTCSRCHMHINLEEKGSAAAAAAAAPAPPEGVAAPSVPCPSCGLEIPLVDHMDTTHDKGLSENDLQQKATMPGNAGMSETQIATGQKVPLEMPRPEGQHGMSEMDMSDKEKAPMAEDAGKNEMQMSQQENADMSASASAPAPAQTMNAEKTEQPAPMRSSEQ